MAEGTEPAPAQPGRERPPAQEYGSHAFLLGWLITFVLFCALFPAWVGLSGAYSANEFALYWLEYFPGLLLTGFMPAMVIGIPLGLLTAWPLRRIPNQWVHVAVHTVVTGAVAAAVVLLVHAPEAALPMGLIFAISAGIGRLSVVKIVTSHQAKQAAAAAAARAGTAATKYE
ncbi:hypothetical protein [Arthrobacter sp. 35W]|uniref:hypothetical protein n=1 Tax=Arthrobacter sp. 35W TaxID=1132441 RepID=UPI0004140B25|nr:hypothetical protein [Arthrobacter sp. 35W]